MSDEIDLADIDPLLSDDAGDDALSLQDLDDQPTPTQASAGSPTHAAAPTQHSQHAQHGQQPRHAPQSAHSHPPQHAVPAPAHAPPSSVPSAFAASLPASSAQRRLSKLRALSSLSSALPLLLSSSTASNLIKTAGLSSLSVSSSSASSSAAARSRGARDGGRAKAPDGSDAADAGAELHRPYFVREGGCGCAVDADSAERLAALIAAVVEREDSDERHDFHFLIRRHAAQLLADHQPTPLPLPTAPVAGAAANAAAGASLSSLLSSYLSSSPASSSFMAAFDALMATQAPFSIRLSLTEQRYYDRIAANMAALLSSRSAGADDGAREALVRYWLGVGSMLHSLRAVNFLLAPAHASAPALSSSLSAYLDAWASALCAMRAPLLRLGRSRHLTAISSSARRVSLVHSAAQAPLKAKRPPCGRKWDCEDDTQWDRYDDRTSALLEAAYQAGKPSLDFTVEGKPHTYRADFTRMVQRNLSTGREKPLRSLLALLIREKNGRITQTVEINMPHNTSIRELRRELASYLKWDEKQLRMMYANHVLRRIDYNHVTIREGIVPLGAEPLIVTKMHKGEDAVTTAQPSPCPARRADLCLSRWMCGRRVRV